MFYVLNKQTHCDISLCYRCTAVIVLSHTAFWVSAMSKESGGWNQLSTEFNYKRFLQQLRTLHLMKLDIILQVCTLCQCFKIIPCGPALSAAACIWQRAVVMERCRCAMCSKGNVAKKRWRCFAKLTVALSAAHTCSGDCSNRTYWSCFIWNSKCHSKKEIPFELKESFASG